MHSAASEHETSSCLVNDGLNELELLLRAVVCHQSESILIVDNDRCCVDASAGASQLSVILGLSDFSTFGQCPETLQDAPRGRGIAEGQLAVQAPETSGMLRNCHCQIHAF